MMSLPTLQSDFALRAYNTFGINAIAHRYIEISNKQELPAICAIRELAGMPRLVLGGGSNILLTQDFSGVVLHVRTKGIGITGEDDSFTYVQAAAGETWHTLVRWTLTQGMGGLENLSFIPGSVGAAPIQNIGAYGAEIKDCLHAVTIFNLDTGNFETLDNAACAFGYRDSVFKHGLRDRAIVVDVTFALPKQWQPNLRYAELHQELQKLGIDRPSPVEVSDAVIAIRTRKLPNPEDIGNAGSFFKNPVVPAEQRHALLEHHPQLVSYAQADGTYKLAAGWLIEQCGWKGKNLGAAGVFEKQALVLVNRGGASGQEIVALANRIQADVLARFGVALEPEPVFI